MQPLLLFLALESRVNGGGVDLVEGQRDDDGVDQDLVEELDALR